MKYVGYFTKFQREAREKDRGLWALGSSSGSSSKKSSSGSSSGNKSTASRSSGPSSKSSGGSAGSSGRKCDPNYAGACVAPYPPDVDCGYLSAQGLPGRRHGRPPLGS